MNAITSQIDSSERPRVVVIGGGFGGLHAARQLGNRPVNVTLIDRRNFHLFQPLLYQVATGGLSPGDIASPLRAVLHRFGNINVVQATVTGFDPARQVVKTDKRDFPYDYLVVAVGAENSYFGNEQWGAAAPALKSVEDALAIRQRIFSAFEQAELCDDPQKRKVLQTFVVIGGGPTGVELAGALTELVRETLADDFRSIDPRESRIVLLEGGARLLPSFPESLSEKATRRLHKMGVEILTRALVVNIHGSVVRFRRAGQESSLEAAAVLWTAGVKASPLAELLASAAGARTDKSGRVIVGPDLTLPGFPNIYLVGDMAHFSHGLPEPLPGVAPVAMQQGRYAARAILRRLKGKSVSPFRYVYKGNLAVIGRNHAIADFGGVRLSGFPAWILWVLVHIAYLVEFDNRMLVMFQWAWNYLTRKRGARLIIGVDPKNSTDPH